MLLSTLALASAQLFTPPISPGAEVALAITAATVTDLNGDGVADFVWTDFGGGRVGWAAGVGNGAFNGARLLSNDTIEPYVQAYVGAIDVDGDGDKDIVYAAENIFNVGARWIENLGQGVFAPRAPLPGGPAVVSGLAVFDIDSDGDDDLVLISGSFGATSLMWMEAQPATGLAPAVVRVPTLGFAFEPKGYDMDGDGIRDVVWRNAFPNGIYWNRSLPGGASSPAQPLLSAVGTVYEFDVVDFEGDGDLDVIAFTSASTLEVFLNDGTGALTGVSVPTPPSIGLNEMKGADLDGDGDMDLVGFVPSGTNQSRSLIYENLGGGNFGAPISFMGGNVQVASGEAGADDIDGDGDLDPWFANQGVLWRPNNGAFGFGEPRPLSVNPLPAPYNGATAGDVDGDGRPELVTTTREGLVVAKNYPQGPVLVETIPVPGEPSMTPHVVDMDGDGDLDVLLSSGRLLTNTPGGVRYFENDGGLLPPVNITGPISLEVRAQPGDANGDGLMDVLVEWFYPASLGYEHAWWLQAPGGAFNQGPRLGVPNYRVLDTGDVDGDGRADTLAARELPGQTQLVRTLTGAGGTFGTTTVIGTLGAPFDSFDVAEFADIDGDGWLDVCAIDPALGLLVARGAGGGAFGPLSLAATSPGFLRDELAVGDVNLDGRLDVVARNVNTLLVFAGDGQGGFASPTEEAPADPTVGQSSDLVLADLDGDHDLDVLRLGTSSVVLYRGTPRIGSGYCQAETRGSNGLRPRIFAMGSPIVSRNDLTLGADRLPPGEFGIFVMSPNRDRVPGAGGAGTLCLGPGLARFQRPGEIRQADAAGIVMLTMDVNNLPLPATVAPGETRYFQYWTRDVIGGVSSSNFSSALSLGFL